MGMDTIDTGAAIGVAAEAGHMKWGDGKRAEELMEEIRRDTPMGRILASGAALAGNESKTISQTVGVSRIGRLAFAIQSSINSNLEREL